MINLSNITRRGKKLDAAEIFVAVCQQQMTQRDLCYFCDTSLTLAPDDSRNGGNIFDLSLGCMVLVCNACDPDYVPDEDNYPAIASSPQTEELDDLVVITFNRLSSQHPSTLDDHDGI